MIHDAMVIELQFSTIHYSISQYYYKFAVTLYFINITPEILQLLDLISTVVDFHPHTQYIVHTH